MHNDVAQIFKAVCAAVIFSLVYVLVFALIIKLFSLPNSAVKPVNQVFKVIVIALASFLFIRGGRGLLKGAICGGIAVACTYILYGIIGGFYLSWLIVAEIFLGCAAGAIGGVIAVNLKKQ